VNSLLCPDLPRAPPLLAGPNAGSANPGVAAPALRASVVSPKTILRFVKSLTPLLGIAVRGTRTYPVGM
jgi:hypothetical protein